MRPLTEFHLHLQPGRIWDDFVWQNGGHQNSAIHRGEDRQHFKAVSLSAQKPPVFASGTEHCNSLTRRVKFKVRHISYDLDGPADGDAIVRTDKSGDSRLKAERGAIQERPSTPRKTTADICGRVEPHRESALFKTWAASQNAEYAIFQAQIAAAHARAPHADDKELLFF